MDWLLLPYLLGGWQGLVLGILFGGLFLYYVIGFSSGRLKPRDWRDTDDD